MPYVLVDGQRIYFSEHRDDLSRKRIPLALVHGAGGVSMNWPPALRRLQDHDVYALDLPGHGRSQGPGRDSIEAYADFLHLWTEAVGLRSFILAGHSMGGAIALMFALRYPQHVQGLALVATGARLRVHPDILASLRTDRAGVGAKLVDWVHGPRATPNQRRQYLRYFLALDDDVMAGDWRACDSFDIRENLPDIVTPALIMVGSQDRMTPVKYSQDLATRLPDADLTIIEGAGHMVMLEQPLLVASALTGFSDRLRQDPRPVGGRNRASGEG